MLPKSPKELLKQILSDISDPEDETVEGIGIATTRKVTIFSLFMNFFNTIF